MKNNISSNRDYATENINLRQQIIDLKVANKDKAETIKSMKQELIEYSKLRDRFKVLYEENKKYKQLTNELGCPPDVVFKAIEYGIVIIGDLEENGDMTLWLDKKPLIVLIGEKRDFEEPRLIKYNEWCFTCESGSYSGCVSLKDYKKTWWLVSDKDSEE